MIDIGGHHGPILSAVLGDFSHDGGMKEGESARDGCAISRFAKSKTINSAIFKPQQISGAFLLLPSMFPREYDRLDGRMASEQDWVPFDHATVLNAYQCGFDQIGN